MLQNVWDKICGGAHGWSKRKSRRLDLPRSADGLWCGVALLGYDIRGKMIRKTVTARSRAEVTRKLAHLRRQVDAGKVTTVRTPTLSELMSRWFEDVLLREVARSTYDNYQTVVKYHVLPALGRRNVADIKVADVDWLLALKLKEGLSSSTVPVFGHSSRSVWTKECVGAMCRPTLPDFRDHRRW
jgi:hypothetical protein